MILLGLKEEMESFHPSPPPKVTWNIFQVLWKQMANIYWAQILADSNEKAWPV